VLSDVYDDTPLDQVSIVVDVLQTPAFMYRQAGGIQRVASIGLSVNIKKLKGCIQPILLLLLISVVLLGMTRSDYVSEGLALVLGN
jgi:hypothetical protein